MGFALWIKDGLSWAMGTHEYRPMGVAIISSTDYFRARDFRPRRGLPSDERSAFVGFFASIEHMNERLRKGPGKRVKQPGMNPL
ncbi:MAG: hypothetical protein JNL62_04700 [Bryobacterales bacterium]|nr:hypothetical protein [Bryobacterales bacterium]